MNFSNNSSNDQDKELLKRLEKAEKKFDGDTDKKV
ncbi:hypothetical protein IYC_03561 [Clostridium sporogenes PA 3679]|uniref:Uncharacterized protein n=1 Tax=Clostridium sporogenes TaxID=1509 RepID=A0A7U4XSX0_CLOSG|nr:hypothetical protein T258_3040 [Clostridium botulinum Prevot_594]AKC61202.1 hypothetical protein CLSPO_c04780 [Clostridium sporogenes]EHN16458.1 hypothetical protein IYC_03561 [Clostridium sporogenes PA 3679]STC73212.1 Uncharacterised protein [Clostridium botulinum]KCZ68503.1 hypothetical protein CSPO_4c00270 [Clostridium sporogenes]